MHRHRRLEDRAHLHAANLGVGDGEAASPETEHGVNLRELLDALDNLVLVRAGVRREHRDDLVEVAVGEELVQGRIEQADGHRAPVHRAEDTLEVLPLKGEQVVQRGFARGGVGSHDHAAHRHDALARAEEHVLGADEADALGAVIPRSLGVLGGVRVGENLEAAEFVDPGHELVQVAGYSGRRELNLAADDLAGGAVEGQPVALVKLNAAQQEPPVLLVDHQLGAARHARLAPAARDNRRVARHTPAGGEDTLRRVHAAHVLRGGLHAHQNALLTLRVELLRGLGVEDHLPDGGAR